MPTIKPTKTEQKERQRALAEGRPYYKAVIKIVKACPHCDDELSQYGTARSCSCGIWSVDWHSGKSIYTAKKEEVHA